MRIEEGKYYRAANGGKVGPISVSKGGRYPFEAPFNGTDPAWYRDDGTCPHISGRDIVAEWTDGPVRTVTRQEIVPGAYDGVMVGYVTNVPDCDNPDAPVVQEVLVTIPSTHMNADELERAAAVLTALAGALRDEQ